MLTNRVVFAINSIIVGTNCNDEHFFDKIVIYLHRQVVTFCIDKIVMYLRVVTQLILE